MPLSAITLLAFLFPVMGGPMTAASNENFWPSDECAKAFWDQHHARPYQQLLRDTIAKTDPQPGERWLDLGCGAGHLSKALWEKSDGKVGQVVASDCASINAKKIEELRSRLTPVPSAEQLTFVEANFSEGLPQFETNSFDGVVAGLTLSYAESFDAATGKFTDTGYQNVLSEIYRILRPGGQLVFSVNVPNPSWGWVFLMSLGGGLRLSKPGKVLMNAIRMMKYGNWLKREARRGRFHYLPLEQVKVKLQKAGFSAAEGTLSYVRQAYVISAEKRAIALARVA